MSEVTRRTVAPPPTPANWFSVKVNSLTVYRTPQDDSYTQETTVDNHNAQTGQTEYTDGNGKGWYTPGEQPEGWTAVQVPSTVLVPRTKRGEVDTIEIVEEDADGKPIHRGTEGYADFEPFDTATLRARAEAKPGTVGVKFQKAVVALQELADALYEDANS